MACITDSGHLFCATGGVLSKTDSVGGQQYDLAEMKALVDEAHMLAMKVAVHAHGTSGIKDAIRAGADTIEHASLADDEAFRLAKAHGTWFSMDIYNDDYILAEGERNCVFKESLEKERVIGLKQRQTFRAAVGAGVRMIFGTDAGVYPNGDNAKQFATMVTWGMTPMQALQAATVNAADALGRTDDVGAVAVGRYGDLVGVVGDPLADVRLLETPAFVMKGGAVVKRSDRSNLPTRRSESAGPPIQFSPPLPIPGYPCCMPDFRWRARLRVRLPIGRIDHSSSCRHRRKTASPPCAAWKPASSRCSPCSCSGCSWVHWSSRTSRESTTRACA